MTARHIESPQNATIKTVAKLRTRRGRQQQGKIVIDGHREVERAIRFGVDVQTIFVPAGQHIDLHAAEIETYFVSDRALKKIAFGDRKEIVAVAAAPWRPIDALQVDDTATMAVLAGLEKPGNVGAILRCADAAGIDAVVLVESRVELFNPNTIRASLGTVFSLPVAETSFKEYHAWAERRQVRHLLAKCHVTATDYRDVDYGPPSAIVLGSEAQGLEEAWAGVGDAVNISVPMAGAADSLNVSCAAAVLFFEAARQRRKPN